MAVPTGADRPTHATDEAAPASPSEQQRESQLATAATAATAEAIELQRALDQIALLEQKVGAGGGDRVRPGTGGRNPVVTHFTPTTATEELIRELGEPERFAHDGVLMMRWHVSKNGDGIIFARLSDRDLQGGETVMGQVHPLREMMKKEGKTPRYVVVTINNSGARRFDDRPDFEFCRQEIEADRVRWVAWRDWDRIARDETPYFLYRDLIRDNEITLYLFRLGRAIDWNYDRFQMNLQGSAAAEERQRIYERCHGALLDRFLQEGRGWPGALPFGFRRCDRTKEPEIDPAQWPYVKMVYYGYIDCYKASETGLRRVQKMLKEAGCELSITTISDIIDKPIYSTGEYSVNKRLGTDKHTTRIICKPVDLGADAIPIDIAQRARELKSIRGGQGQLAAGTHLLNGLIEHECGCALRTRMSRSQESERTTYRHYGERPDCCRRVTFYADVIDAAVVRELRRVVTSSDLAEAWIAAARADYSEISEVFDEETIAEMKGRMSRLEESKAALQRKFNDRLVEGEDLNERDYADMVRGVADEINNLERAITRAQSLAATQTVLAARIDHSEDLAEELYAILTEEPPKDEMQRARRAALVRLLVSKAVVYGKGDDVSIQIHGPLVPQDMPLAAIPTPKQQAVEVMSNGELDDAAKREVSANASLGGHFALDEQSFDEIRGRRIAVLQTATPKPLRLSADQASWLSPQVSVLDATAATGREFTPGVLRRCAELFIELVGWTATARALAAAGVPAPRRKSWHPSTVRDMLLRALVEGSLPEDLVDDLRASVDALMDKYPNHTRHRDEEGQLLWKGRRAARAKIDAAARSNGRADAAVDSGE